MIDFKTLYEKTKGCSLLLVEDYEPLRADMAEVLEDFFATVTVASNGVEAIGLYDKHYKEAQRYYDVVITDIQMPMMDGIDLAEEIRKRNPKQQLIVLSAYTDSEYLIRLINIGIAQFINKPVEQDELVEALFVVCNNRAGSETDREEETIVRLGEEVVWHKKSNILRKEGYPVPLTRHESVLMQLFVERANQVCTADTIMQHFYLQGVELSERSIRNLVSKLRKKLPARAIKSIYGMGYRLVPLHAS